MKGGVTTTRSKTKATGEAQISLEEARASSSVAQRSLTNEEKKMLKTFILAFVADYEKNFRDEDTTPAEEWKDITTYLKSLHTKTVSEYESRLKRGMDGDRAVQEVMALEYEELSENDLLSKKWRKMSLDFTRNGIENIEPVFKHLKIVRDELAKKFAENFSMARVLPEGNIRLNILKNYSYREFLQAHKKRSISQLSNQEKLDFLMLLNDPSSKLFDSLLHEIQALSFATAKDMIMLTADIVDKDGNKTGEKKFNVNTHKGDGVTVLFETLRARVKGSYTYYPAHIVLINYLIGHEEIDLTIPINIKEHQGNVVSYLLLLLKGQYDVWGVLKYILTIQPITSFYRDDLKEKCQGKSYGINIVGDKQVCIGNVWIFRNLSQLQIEWLVDHGKLDMKAGYGRANVYRSLESDVDELEKAKEKTESEYTTTQNSVQQLYDTIIKLTEDYKDLIKVRDATLEESRKVAAEFQTSQQVLNRLVSFFERHNITRYFGGKKRTTKREKKV